MPRLVTFGCSHTYGQGLPDCWIDNRAGPVPSNYAWPTLLAKKLNLECVNLSSPGSGNFQILINLLKAELRPDDLVILAFSYFVRYDFYVMTDKIQNGKMVKFITPKINQNYNEFKEMVLSQADNQYWEEQNYWDNWLAIQHCELYLNSKQIKNFSFLNVSQGALEKRPEIIKLNNFWADVHLMIMDKALDNSHPGVGSQMQQATKIYNKLGNLSIANHTQ